MTRPGFPLRYNPGYACFRADTRGAWLSYRAHQMAATSSTSKRLKALAKEIPDEAHVRGLLRFIEHQRLQSDYAVAIVGASLIERALEVAILSRFVPVSNDERGRLFDYKSPLGSFSARIRIGAALGLYGPVTFADLEIIRNVRNQFAHSPVLRTFSDVPIAKSCGKLKLLDFIFRHEPRPEPAHPLKANYIDVCLHISGRLRARLDNVFEERVPPAFPMSDAILP